MPKGSLRGRKRKGASAADEYVGWRSWMANRAVNSATGRRWMEWYARRHGWTSLEEDLDEFDDDPLPLPASSLPAEQGLLSRLNAVVDVDGSTQFNSMVGRSVRFGVRASGAPDTTNNNYKGSSTVFCPGGGIKYDNKRRYEMAKFLKTKFETKVSGDFGGSASATQWTFHSNGYWESMFNSKELVAQLYGQSIAANGSIFSVTPGNTHSSSYEDLLVTAVRDSPDFFLYQPEHSAALAIPVQDTTAPYDGNMKYLRGTLYANMWLENYKDSYRVFNSGNAQVTCRFLIVTPRKAIARARVSTAGEYPDTMNWDSFMDEIQKYEWVGATDNSETGSKSLYGGNDTASGDIINVAASLGGTTYLPFGANTYYSGFTEKAVSWKDLKGPVGVYSFKTVNKFYKVREIKFTLSPGQHKVVNVCLRPQLVKLRTVDGYVYNSLNYRCFMLTHGEICTGTTAGDSGYSAHVTTVRSEKSCSVRYALPRGPVPKTYTLISSTFTVGGGTGTIYDEATGATETAYSTSGGA